MNLRSCLQVTENHGYCDLSNFFMNIDNIPDFSDSNNNSRTRLNNAIEDFTWELLIFRI
jgi:hypothetical protein